jgi:hypothetical protein
VPRHHIVPQMYLRHFADERRMLRLVDRDDLRRTVPSTVNKACNEVGFYEWQPGLALDEVEDPAVLDPEHVEGLLSGFEGAAAPCIQRILESGRPPETKEDRYHLAHFIAIQAARGRRFREDLSQMGTWAPREHLRERLTPAEVEQRLARRGLPHAPSDVAAYIAEMLSPRGPRLVPSTTFATQQALRFAFEDIAPRLFTGAWRVITFAEPALLTSDEPVVAWHPDDEPVTAKTAPYVWIPLGRRHLLEVHHPDTSGASSERNDSYPADWLNSIVATQAERWIVHHPEDGHLLQSLQVGPRTQWSEEVLEIHDEGDRVRVRGRLRRLPKD